MCVAGIRHTAAATNTPERTHLPRHMSGRAVIHCRTNIVHSGLFSGGQCRPIARPRRGRRGGRSGRGQRPCWPSTAASAPSATESARQPPIPAKLQPPPGVFSALTSSDLNTALHGCGPPDSRNLRTLHRSPGARPGRSHGADGGGGGGPSVAGTAKAKQGAAAATTGDNRRAAQIARGPRVGTAASANGL